MIKGILWDNDGVLVNTEEIFYATNREIFSEQGIDLSPGEFIAWFLEDNRGAWHLLRERGYSDRKISELRKARNAAYTAALHQSTGLARSGIADLLARLYRKIPMGIVTASFKEDFYLMHGKLQFLNYFDFVLTRNKKLRPKPHPDSYLLGLKKLGVLAANCIAVEDSPRGLAAATAAGIKCIVIRSNLLMNYQFVNAYRVVDSVDELTIELGYLLNKLPKSDLLHPISATGCCNNN
ncbi:HAD family phosphatase [Glaciimonas sp. CA11.2]|uniref:HAD family hydrolase n=1 Tax=Glaciimonas sp. CA11.2 TaxID=3048601 RepID=UPI002AB37837|nr:HAD family phosphatase [Glaciimonas sp. CA11.2]MDY7546731.1 HAD family phosphatase [Glaciimonas sp. CA11.2]MEB0162894.1 HAD family phosphatase [Glaciimonas sp. CA11.2]